MSTRSAIPNRSSPVSDISALGELRNELPLVPGEVVAWRAWVVLSGAGHREPRLRSLYHHVVWPTDRWLVAGEGDDPNVDKHGICAARDREHLVGMHRYGRESHPRYVETSEITAIGQVGLAGVITPGDRGFRAEKARPLSILLPYVAWDLVESLRRAYRVSVSLSNVLIGEPHGHRA
jgi:hypothetical protein